MPNIAIEQNEKQNRSETNCLSRCQFKSLNKEQRMVVMPGKKENL